MIGFGDSYFCIESSLISRFPKEFPEGQYVGYHVVTDDDHRRRSKAWSQNKGRVQKHMALFGRIRLQLEKQGDHGRMNNSKKVKRARVRNPHVNCHRLSESVRTNNATKT